MEAMKFDSENKNSKSYDAIKLEMESMLEYKVFKKWDKAILDKHKKVMNPPNRILSKVQKSFCSCTHVNSCQNYALYVNLHILLNI